MLSKNNFHEKLRKMEPRKERYSIRKFTIGAASVLLGFFIYGSFNGTTVHAAVDSSTQIVKENTDTNVVSKTNSTVQDIEEKTSQNTQKQNIEQADGKSDKQVTKNDIETETQPVQTNTNKTSANENSTKKESIAQEKATPASAKTDGSKNTQNNTQLQKASPKVERNNIDIAASTSTSEAIHVSNMQDFISALNNQNVNDIIVDGSLTNTSNNSYNINNARKLEISGADENSSVDFGTGYINLTSGNNPWDITVNNLKLSTTNQLGYGVISSNNGTNGSISFNNVTAGGNGCLTYTPNMDVNVANTTVNSESNVSGPNIYANNVTVGNNVNLSTTPGSTYTSEANIQASGTVTFNGTNIILTATNNNVSGNYVYNVNAGGNVEFTKDSNVILNANIGSSTGANAGAAIYQTAANGSYGDVIVDPNAKLVINSSSSRDMGGIYFENDGHGFQVSDNANVEMNLGHGYSAAVYNVDNLVISPNASLIINTLEDNDGNTNSGWNGAHYGPISVGVGNTYGSSADVSNVTNSIGAAHTTIDVQNGGSLQITRNVDSQTKNSASPLIVFGNTSAGGGPAFNLNVNGGKLVLKDALQMPSYSGTNDVAYQYLLPNGQGTSIYPLGMIAMYGTSSIDRITITNPELFSLDRTGEQQGMLLRLEGTDNKVQLTATSGNAIPIEFGTTAGVQYQNGNTSSEQKYTVYVTNLTSVNKMGNWSMNFNNKGGSTSTSPSNWSKGVSFGNSEGTVTFAPNTSKADQQAFNNYFNWWGTTGFASGTDLTDTYTPSYPNSEGKTGTPTTVSPVIKNQSGNVVNIPSGTTFEPDGTLPDGVTVNKDTGVITIPAQDKPGTVTTKVIVNIPGQEPQTVTSTTTIKQAPATDTYTPSYPNSEGKTGTTTTISPVIKNQSGNVVNIPSGTTFEPDGTLPDGVTVNKDTGVITIPAQDKPGTVTTKVIVKIPGQTPQTITSTTTIKQSSETPTTDTYTPSYPNSEGKTGTTTTISPVIKNQSGNVVNIPSGTTFEPDGTLPDGVTVNKDTGVITIPAQDKPGTVTTKVIVNIPGQDPQTITSTTTIKQSSEIPTTDTYTPSYPNSEGKTGTPTTVSPVIRNQSGNVVNIPSGTTFEPDGTLPDGVTVNKDTGVITIPAQDKPGTVTTKVIVNIPGQDPQTITSTTTIKQASDTSESDNEKYTPVSKNITTSVGTLPAASDGIANKDELPKGTTYQWQNTPDVSTAGTKHATVIVTYPDKTTSSVPVTITVESGSSDNTNTGDNKDNNTQNTGNTSNDKNTTDSGKDNQSVDKNNSNKNTSQNNNNNQTKNNKPAHKSSTDKSLANKKHVTTTVGTLPDPASTINKSKLPKGSTVKWENKPDVSTPGTKKGSVVVTYPDGTTHSVPVTIIVRPHATRNNGSSTEVNSTTNSTNNNSDAEMPRSSSQTDETNRANWLKNHSYDVVVNAQGQIISYQKSRNGQGSITVKNTLPQTGAKQINFLTFIGLALTTLAALFSFTNRNRKND